jgi:hypothetical protein
MPLASPPSRRALLGDGDYGVVADALARGADVAAVLAPGLGDQGATPRGIALVPSRNVFHDGGFVDVHDNSSGVDRVCGVDVPQRRRGAEPGGGDRHRGQDCASFHLSPPVSVRTRTDVDWN